MLYHHTPHTAHPDLCSFHPSPSGTSAPLAVLQIRGPEQRGPHSGARGSDRKGPPGSEGCNGMVGCRAERKRRRRRERGQRRVENHSGRRAGWQDYTVVGCMGGAGGQGPAGDSPGGQPAYLKSKSRVKSFNWLCMLMRDDTDVGSHKS